ncbi:hypothetical protein [Brevibacterium sp. HMSC22B09]|uniref:hypothetical protein n=1 Tax=Brevibacterium sp. HMSC22B09 TaxID=1581055 RepID=UPI0008A62970|nr:hypothetical protein [Brevibacterium sp. HMSC22B09]OFT99305.1 hypothetical protein HMPREF3087_00305 [Brevibacterium sp. HMSC22B09]
MIGSTTPGAKPQPPPTPDREEQNLRAALDVILSAETPEAVESAEALIDRIESILDARAS